VGHESASGRIHLASGNEIRETGDAEAGIAANIDAPERLEIDRDVEREPVIARAATHPQADARKLRAVHIHAGCLARCAGVHPDFGRVGHDGTLERRDQLAHAEAAALRARLAILVATLKSLDSTIDAAHRGEILNQEMLAEAQLALNANTRHDKTATATWLARALAQGDDIHTRAGGVTDKKQLDVLWLAAQLTVSEGAVLVPDLPKRIAAAATELATRREPSLRRYAGWFEVYGALVR